MVLQSPKTHTQQLSTRTEFRRAQKLKVSCSVPQCKMGGCQNYGPFLCPYYNTAPFIQGTQKRDHNFDNHPNGSRTLLTTHTLKL